MKPFSTTLSTGIPDLDHTIRGVLAGDNIVWQVDDIAEYQAFVLPFAQAAQDNGRVLVYFRFARHAGFHGDGSSRARSSDRV